MKISEAFDFYANCEILAVGGSLNTCDAYKYAAKAFIRAWGDIKIEEITVRMTREFSCSFQKDHSTSTVRNYTTCLRAVLALCETNGFEVVNPKLIRPPKPTKTTPAYVSEHEINRLITAANTPRRGYPAINRLRNVLIIKMLYATGLRVGELVRLNIGDIHNREFTVIGKSKEPRTCYITAEIEELIKEYIDKRSDSNRALFVSSQTGGQRISKKTVQLMFRKVRKKAGIRDVHPHTMRHSFCTKLLEEGVDIRDAAELMGHQSWNTTKIYTHIRNARLKNIYDKAMKGD